MKHLSVLSLLLMMGPASGADLFSTVVPLQPQELALTERAGIVADLDIQLLENQQTHLDIQVESGRTLVVKLDAFRRNSQKSYSWKGHLQRDPSQTVNLSVYEDAIAGSIHTDTAVYEIQPLGGYQVRVVELNSAAFPACAGGLEPAHQAPDRALGNPVNGVPGPQDVDVIVVYTPQARDGAGGETQIKATAQAAVDAMNSSLDNSLVDTTIHLLYAGLVNYNDTGDSALDLDWLQASTEVRALLDTYGADMASLLVESSGACGRGYVMRNPGPGFRDFAVQVTTRSCAVGNLSFAHEFGHNMGLEHDPANGTSPGNASYPWSFGHYHSGEYRTVMSYSNQCAGGCTRRQYYSNPDVTYLGLPTGIAEQRDNARSLRLTSPVTAAFRERTSEDVIFSQGFEISVIFEDSFESMPIR